MALIGEQGPRFGIAPTCAALKFPRATYYRHRQPRIGPPRPRPAPPRALSREERTVVQAVLNEPRFVDLAPAEVYATLLDEGTYLCSERTLYRVLAENAEVRERRDQIRHPHYAAPELLATRPNVSNDNPFSESQFKTMKYRPDFPERFGSIEHGRSHCGDFFPWYNTEHHHVGLGLFTPHDVHFGLAKAKREQRTHVLAGAFAQHPERFPNGRPSPRPLPTAVWINPPKATVADEDSGNTTTPEPNTIPIEALRSSLEAELERERPEIPNLKHEERCIAVVQ